MILSFNRIPWIESPRAKVAVICHIHQKLEALTIWPTQGFQQFLRHLLFLWLDCNFQKLLLCLGQLCEDTGLNTGDEDPRTIAAATNLNE